MKNPPARAVVACVALVAALAAALAAPARAEPAAPIAPAAPASAARGPLVPVYAPDAELLAAFGGAPGIHRLADALVDRMRADPRIGHHFENTKLARLKTQIGDQLCQVLAGPCVYDGDTMKAAHGELGITRADSLALVELLQSAMDASGIPFRAQNRLLARLAPMFRDIIER